MDPSGSHPVIVGVRTSPATATAVRQAAQEAGLRGRSLRVVHAFRWPLFCPPAADGTGYGDPRGDAEHLVRAAVAGAGDAWPGLPVEGDVLDGAPLPTLLALSRRAAVVVLGNERLGRTACLPADSLAVQVAARAACPVMITYTGPRAEGPVIVGLDGSPSSRAALDLALVEGRLRGCPVVGLHAEDPDGAGCAGREAIDRSLASARAGHPDVRVEVRTVPWPADQALIEHSRHARLAVVGVRGWRPTLLGPATQALLHHAGCPVVVTHPSRPDAPRRAGQTRHDATTS